MKPLLLIAITILAVGCGEKNESTADTKPVEEKVVEVKKEAKTEEPVTEVNPEDRLAENKQVTLDWDKLELRPKNRNGLVYLKDSNTIFTGIAVNYHPNGQRATEGHIKDGMSHGPSLYWHENGQKAHESKYIDDKLVEGSEKFWNRKGESVGSWPDTVK